MLSSRVVSCGSAICLIMLSTASVAMKLLFGVKPGRFCLLSTIWIAASHRRDLGARPTLHSKPLGQTHRSNLRTVVFGTESHVTTFIAALTNAQRGSANAPRDGDREACSNSPLSVLLVKQRDKFGEAANDHRNPCSCNRRHELRLAHRRLFWME